MENLKHIEIESKKKKNSDEVTLEKSLQTKLAESKKLLGQDLSQEEREILDCFEKKRMLLQRLYIIFNQSRKTMNQSLSKEKDLRDLLEKLKDKGYIEIEKFEYNNEEREAFILSEKGEQIRA